MTFSRILQMGAILYAIVSVVSALLLPTWWVNYLDNLLFPLALLHCLRVFIQRKEFRWILGLFFALGTVATFSELIHQAPLFRAHASSILLILKFPVLLTAVIQNEIVERRLSVFEKSIDLIFLIVVGLNLFMALDPFGLGYALHEYYVPKSYMNFIYYNEWGTFRLSGIYTNPNNNALVFGAFFIYYFFTRKSEWPMYVLALSLIVLTQSRTVFLSVLLISCLQFLRRGNLLAWLKQRWYYLLIVILIGAGVVYSSSNLRSLFTLEAISSNSLMVRLQNFQKFTGVSDMWLGTGVIDDPLSAYGLYLDSEFVAVLFQFGLLGLILLTTIIFSGFFITSRTKEWAVQSIFLLLLFGSLTNTTFFNVQVGALPAFFLGWIIFKTNDSKTPTKSPAIEPR